MALVAAKKKTKSLKPKKKPTPVARIVGTTTLAGKKHPFSAVVHPPVREASGDYTCRVQMSLHRPIDTRIVGATAKQAKELAVAFIQSLMPQAMFP